MRISFTDQWQTLFDENGKPLVGRVKFMKADASQFKPVYYEDEHGNEVLAPNPCYTMQDGRLEHQIFLDYGVYTCIVEKFIGEDSSNMTDYANYSDYWPEIKSFKAYGGEEPSSSSGDLSSGFVDSIADLRLVNPSEHSVVDVVGYYSKDDGIEPRTYVWVEGTNFSEDFGSTIISSLSGFTTTGAWKLCESPILCGTTFGVFPDRSSTISASDLTTKATALCNFANNSYCSKVMLKAGQYYFAEGARLSFSKPVTTDASSSTTIKFDMDGIQDLGEDETLNGTIEIAFMRGLEYRYVSPITSNAEYVTFTFGSFSEIKTSWIIDRLQKHIDKSASSSHVKVILNSNSYANFCGDNKTFDNWDFVGNTLENQLRVGSNVTFKNCSFKSKCFSAIGSDCTFIECGDVYQESLMPSTSYLFDTCIFNSNASVKSYGTRFYTNKFRVTQSYNTYLDNSLIIPFGDNPLIVANNETILEFFDHSWTLSGVIYFANIDYVYAPSYESFSNCVTSSLASSKRINLGGKSFSYTINTTDVSSARTFRFENGTLSLGKTGSGSTPDVVSLDKVVLNAASTLVNISLYAKGSEINNLNTSHLNAINLDANDCVFTTSGLAVIACEAVDTEFNGQVSLIPYNGKLEQRFSNCIFSKSVVANTNASGVYANFIISGCTFNIDNNGTPISAISIGTIGDSSTFAPDNSNKYCIEANTYLGDAFLLPTNKATFKVSSSTDGSTTPTPAYGLASVGNLEEAYGYAGNLLLCSVNSFDDANFIKSKIFHIGEPVLYLKAVPETRSNLINYGSGAQCYIVPLMDYCNGTIISNSKSVFMIFGDNPTDSDRWTIIRNAIPQIEWIVEISKSND